VSGAVYFPGDQRTNLVYGYFYLETPALERVEMQTDGAHLRAYKKLGTTWYLLKERPYDAFAMRYLRFREAAGASFWEYSADTTSWKTLYSELSPIPMHEVRLLLIAGTGGGTQLPATVYFDNVNLP
jgi:hypothetical protein